MSRDPDPEEISLLVALFNAGRYIELERRAALLVDTHPVSGMAWKVLGASLQAQGKDALPALRRAAKLLPEDADANSNLGVALKTLGQLEQAVAYYHRALEIKPDYAEAHSNLGTALRTLGKLDDAVTSYRRALDLKSDYTQANFNLGNALQALGRFDDALASYVRVLEVKPDYAEVLGNLGNAQQTLGLRHRAAASYRRALALKPNYIEVHSNLGNVLRELGQFDDAVASYRLALALAPAFAEPHSNLGNALQDIGQLDAAAKSCGRAIQIKPDFAEAHCNLGNALQVLGSLNDAVRSYRLALKIKPEYPEVHSNLGTALRELGLLDYAVASYHQALEIRPDYAEAHNNLGNALRDLGQIDSAEANYRRAAVIKPDYAEAHTNLGIVLKDIWQLDSAVACYRRALEFHPAYAEAHNHLGRALRDLGQLDSAVTSCRRALDIQPDCDEARIALLMLTLLICPSTASESCEISPKFDRSLDNFSEWLSSLEDRHPHFHMNICSQPPFYLAYRNGNHKERLTRFGDLLADSAGAVVNIARSRTQGKLRLAVVSRHFHNHSVWHIITRGLLENLDRQKFEIVIYHVGHSSDEQTELAKSLADFWRDASTVGDSGGWPGTIAADHPDIILYPEIGMDHRTLSLASYRLAPLQVAYWGHPITSGLPTIDLFFSGELLESRDADSHYRERLVRLPGTGCCTTPMEVAPRGLTELEAELASRPGPRFVIAQMPFKFDPSDDMLYVRIATSIGHSTFILLRSAEFPWATDRVCARLSRAFRENGLIPEKHLLLIPWLSREKFYSLLDLCDVYLDCPSFSGYTTAWQAIHRGLPVVTLEGQFMRQRLAAGLLRKIGLTETIANTSDQYVTIAIRLAEECRDPAQRNARRQSIISAAPRMDNDISVVRAFESILIDTMAAREMGVSLQTEKLQAVLPGIDNTAKDSTAHEPMEGDFVEVYPSPNLVPPDGPASVHEQSE
jgi:predicted O-linked N-acetylglucosamine transferase (SPINDLY family)